MERTERYGLGVAAAGHILLFGLLSVGFLATPNPLKLESKPIDISLVDEVSLKAAAPAATEAPATSQAPDEGPPEDAPPPLESVAQPEPAPAPAPQPPAPAPPAPTKAAPPRPAPAPKPIPQPKAAAPAPARPAPKAAPAPAKAAARPALARPNVTPERAGSDAASSAKRPRGSLLGDDFRKSLAISAEKGTAQAPRAAAVSARAVAGLADAIARQVQPCANRITNPGPGANLIRTKLRIRMNPDGSLASRPVIGAQTGVNDQNGRYAQRVGELASAAVQGCAPYKLPPELYEGGWKDIIINYRLPG